MSDRKPKAKADDITSDPDRELHFAGWMSGSNDEEPDFSGEEARLLAAGIDRLLSDCEPFVHSLLDFASLHEDEAAASMPKLAAHLAECPRCGAQITELRSIPMEKWEAFADQVNLFLMPPPPPVPIETVPTTVEWNVAGWNDTNLPSPPAMIHLAMPARSHVDAAAGKRGAREISHTVVGDSVLYVMERPNVPEATRALWDLVFRLDGTSLSRVQVELFDDQDRDHGLFQLHRDDPKTVGVYAPASGIYRLKLSWSLDGSPGELNLGLPLPFPPEGTHA